MSLMSALNVLRAIPHTDFISFFVFMSVLFCVCCVIPLKCNAELSNTTCVGWPNYDEHKCPKTL